MFSIASLVRKTKEVHGQDIFSVFYNHGIEKFSLRVDNINFYFQGSKEGTMIVATNGEIEFCRVTGPRRSEYIDTLAAVKHGQFDYEINALLTLIKEKELHITEVPGLATAIIQFENPEIQDND